MRALALSLHDSPCRTFLFTICPEGTRLAIGCNKWANKQPFTYPIIISSFTSQKSKWPGTSPWSHCLSTQAPHPGLPSVLLGTPHSSSGVLLISSRVTNALNLKQVYSPGGANSEFEFLFPYWDAPSFKFIQLYKIFFRNISLRGNSSTAHFISLKYETVGHTAVAQKQGTKIGCCYFELLINICLRKSYFLICLWPDTPPSHARVCVSIKEKPMNGTRDLKVTTKEWAYARSHLWVSTHSEARGPDSHFQKFELWGFPLSSKEFLVFTISQAKLYHLLIFWILDPHPHQWEKSWGKMKPLNP